MSASWVAGSVRSRSLASRRLGRDRARSVAASPSLDAAVRELVGSPYGHDLRIGQRLPEAQEALLATSLWHLRVMAGWLPRSGAELARVLAGYWETADIAILLASMEGGDHGTPFELGTLGTVWDRARTARTPDQVRLALARSAWGDPGTSEPAGIVSWMRMRWAERLALGVPGAYEWGAGMLALMVARELFVTGRRPGVRPWPASPLGSGWRGAATIPELAKRLPSAARWALEGVVEPSELWRAEARWWSRVEADSLAMLAGFRPGRREVVVASAAVLLADAWRARAALETADRGGMGLEVFHELA